MALNVVRSMIVTLAIAGLTGCQSMSHMAWWKKDKEDATTVAKSTPPPLPSTQAKAQAVAGVGIEPATSPSTANLAAAQTTTAPLAATSPSATPATATSPATPTGTSSNLTASVLTTPPTGFSTYPSTGAPAPTYPASTGAAAPARAATTMAAAAPTTPTSASQAGPYDPTGYRPAAPTSAGAGGADRYAGAAAGSASADRYGSMPGSTQAVQSAPPTAGIAASAPAPATADRNSAPAAAATPDVASRYASLPPAPATTSAPANTAAGTDRYGMPIAVAPASAAVSSTASSNVQLASPAAQYRPGGTSNYANGASDHVEVATRPGTAAPSAPVDGAAPATYPPMPESSIGAGVRPY